MAMQKCILLLTKKETINILQIISIFINDIQSVGFLPKKICMKAEVLRRQDMGRDGRMTSPTQWT